MVGDSTPYELIWLTAYRFHQRLVARYRAGRVLLAGDAAHLMSPFGARGLNSGAADAENLAWKLALVLAGSAPQRLLDSYHHERRAAAQENLAVTDRTMRFMVPRGRLRLATRDAILRGSLRAAALRRWVNSGKLAQPFAYVGSPIIADGPGEPDLPPHGAVAPDFACRRLGRAGEPIARLLDLVGDGFLALVAHVSDPAAAARAAVRASRLAYPAPVRIAAVGPDRPLRDVAVLAVEGESVSARYLAAGPRAWLIRPDGHLAASLALGSAADVDGLAGLVALAIGATPAGPPANAG